VKVIDLLNKIAKDESTAYLPSPFIINDWYWQRLPDTDKDLFKELLKGRIKLNDEVITDIEEIKKWLAKN
jgi:TRAP-type C4-dicarboxylate transport system substrate-binding protein